MSKRLEDNLALAAGPARWAVETWALALGVVTVQQLAAAQPNPKLEQKPAQKPLQQAPAGQPRVVTPVAPPVIVARRPTPVRSRTIMLTICLVLAGSGAVVTAIWHRPSFSHARREPLQISSTKVDLQGRLPAQVTVSAVRPELQQGASSDERAGRRADWVANRRAYQRSSRQGRSGASPPITDEEVAIARGALLPQPPWVAAESAPQ